MILNCNATIEKPITSGTVIYFTSSNFSSPISHSTGANSRYLTCRLHIVQGSESLSGLAILSEHQRSTDLIKSKGRRKSWLPGCLRSESGLLCFCEKATSRISWKAHEDKSC